MFRTKQRGFSGIPKPLQGPSGLSLTVLFLQVVFGRKLTSFAAIALNQLQHEKKYDIYFTDGDVYALYR